MCVGTGYVADLVDIVENGPPGESSGGFLAGPRGRFLTGALVVAVLVVVGIGEVRRRHPSAGPTPAPSEPSPTVVAALVETGTGTSYQTNDASKDFVVQVDLINFNRAPVQVRAATPDHPGFDRLVVAVLPAKQAPGPLDYDAVAAAARVPVSLGGNETAELTLAGRVACGTPAVSHNTMKILVDGAETTVAIPGLDESNWAAAMKHLLCAKPVQSRSTRFGS